MNDELLIAFQLYTASANDIESSINFFSPPTSEPDLSDERLDLDYCPSEKVGEYESAGSGSDTDNYSIPTQDHLQSSPNTLSDNFRDGSIYDSSPLFNDSEYEFIQTMPTAPNEIVELENTGQLSSSINEGSLSSETKPSLPKNVKKRPRDIDPTKEKILERTLKGESQKPKYAEPLAGYLKLPQNALLTPASPEKSYGNIPLAMIGDRKYRLFSTNKTRAIWTENTPVKGKGEAAVQGKGEQIELSFDPDLLERLELKIESELAYDVTLASIQKNQHTSRGISQQQLMGTTAQQFFKMHALKIKHVKSRDENAYQWGHLWAVGLGGGQKKENLIACTTESNIMMRCLVEDTIRHLLKNDTNKVHVNTKLACQSKDQKIPDLVIYQLSWINKHSKKNKELTININPRSTTLYTTELGKLVRELCSDAEDNKENQAEQENIKVARKLF